MKTETLEICPTINTVQLTIVWTTLQGGKAFDYFYCHHFNKTSIQIYQHRFNVTW